MAPGPKKNKSRGAEGRREKKKKSKSNSVIASDRKKKTGNICLGKKKEKV